MRWIWGYGCHEAGGWELSCLPPWSRQTINRAELQVEIDTVRHFYHEPLKVAVAMDSAYVICNMHGNAMKWKAQQWVASQRPVVNVDLWMEPLSLLEEP